MVITEAKSRLHLFLNMPWCKYIVACFEGWTKVVMRWIPRAFNALIVRLEQ